MANSKYIVVNGEAESSIIDGFQDLCTYLDSKSGDDSHPLQSLAAEFREVLSKHGNTLTLPPAAQEYFFTIAENSATILKVPPGDFESVSNLLLFVLSRAPDFETLVPVVLANLSNSTPTANAQLVALIAVLSNLYNILPFASPQKASVFDKIVDLSNAAKTTPQFISQLPRIADWIKEWSSDPEFVESIAFKLVNNIENSPRITTFLTKLVADERTSTPKLADLLIETVLTDEHNYDFLDVYSLPAIKKTAKYEVFKAIADGDYKSFAQLQINDNRLKTKAQITTLSTLASLKSELSYEEISNAVEVPIEQVELLILSAIKHELIMGRMNQLAQKFEVDSATIFGAITDSHWSILSKNIASWQSALEQGLSLE